VATSICGLIAGLKHNQQWLRTHFRSHPKI
jgi:hypothetical protein